MSLSFSNSENLDSAALASLTTVCEAACDELAAEHYFSSSQLAARIDEMTTEIRALYRAGQRGQTNLTHHAVTCALLSRKREIF
jgi:hypothetical protein